MSHPSQPVLTFLLRSPLHRPIHPAPSSAEQHDSNQPRPASDPIVSEGGPDYKPTTQQGAEPIEEGTGGSATVGERTSITPSLPSRSSVSSVSELTDVGLDHAEELDGLSKDNILDNETGVQTRGVQSDAYAKEKEVDAAVDAAVEGDEGQKQ